MYEKEIFCTYFDSNYLTRALALYNSLLLHVESFHLWALCLDEKAYSIISRLSLPGLSAVSLDELEQGDLDLLKAKSNRSVIEYYFTITPSLLLFVLRKAPEYHRVTYLDADLYFFSDPAPIFEEFGDSSVLIIAHRFAERLKHLEKYGKYNVGFLTFQRSDSGLNCLRWWRTQCLEWCYDRVEDGRFADQKYLDSWPIRFEGVKELKNLGAGLAPWNFGNYNYSHRNGKFYVNTDELIFYHFHRFKRLWPFLLDPSLAAYDSDSNKIRFMKRSVYMPYMREFNSVNHLLSGISSQSELTFGSIREKSHRSLTLRSSLKLFKRFIHIGRVVISQTLLGNWWVVIKNRII